MPIIARVCAMRFHSNIGRPKAGWIQFRFTGDGGEIDVTASSVPNDPFYELVTAVQAVFANGGSHDVRINEEPEESILTFEKEHGRLLLLWRSNSGATLGRISVPFDSGCREIARDLYHLHSDVGCEVFAKEWYHQPPRERIADLWSKFDKRKSR